MALVEFKNISKIYKMEEVQVRAVDNVSLAIEKGEFAAISGPSGSGKSTMLNIMGLIDLPSEGTVILDGIDIYKDINLTGRSSVPLKLDARLTDLRRNFIGFVFQTFNLIPVLNVRENIEIPLHLGNSPAFEALKGKEKNEWIDYLIETVGLAGWKNVCPNP